MIPHLAQGALLDAAQACPMANLSELAPGPVLVLAPHPDDETFGCGLAIASATTRSVPVHVVAVTRGEASHPGSRSHPPKRMASLRGEEFAAAVSILGDGAATTQMLDYPDGRLGMEHTEALAKTVYAMISDRDIAVIWATWAGDPHCDHQIVAAAAEQASTASGVPLWHYPVWGRFGARAIPSAHRMIRFDDAAVRERKRRAAREYRSQTTNLVSDDPKAFCMPEALLHHFVEEPEIFIEGAAAQ